MEETSDIIKTLISSPSDQDDDSSLPNLSFDLVEEILARLPVKFLLQFRCVCKTWNSLITDNPKFAKKHLRFSKTNRRLLLNTVNLNPSKITFKNTRKRSNATQKPTAASSSPTKYILKSYPIKSTFKTTRKRSNAAQHHYPPNGEALPWKETDDPIIGSCDGILCLAGNSLENFVILWNPSIRKFKELPPFEMPNVTSHRLTSYGFGYYSLSDNYKAVVVIYYMTDDFDSGGHRIFQNQVKVHSLGTNFWRKIQEFPHVPFFDTSGKFVSGKLNWLTGDGNNISSSTQYNIVSLDLGNESYQEVLQPDYGEEELEDVHNLIMSVLDDCLSLLSCKSVWVKKEYGNKESWTKIFSFPGMENFGFTKTIYFFEDHQQLLSAIRWRGELALCDYKNGTVKRSRMDNIPEVLVESLISPS